MMAADSQLHSFTLEGFWMDVGQPKDFLTGTCLYLTNVNKINPGSLANPNSGYVHGGNVLVDPTAKIGKDCRIGPNVVIGPGVVIGDGVRLQRCVLLEGSSVKDHAWIKNTIVGWHSTIGRWVRTIHLASFTCLCLRLCPYIYVLVSISFRNDIGPFGRYLSIG